MPAADCFPHGHRTHRRYRPVVRNQAPEPRNPLLRLQYSAAPRTEFQPSDGQPRHPRFVCHFIPTSSSWLNLVERRFRVLTEKSICRGRFASVPDLKQAIDGFRQAWNENPKPFIWTATVSDIIAKIERARLEMEHVKPGSTLPRGKKTATNV